MQRSAKFSGELSRICDFIETKPVFMINDLVDAFQISYNTASSRVDMLVEMNIVKKGTTASARSSESNTSSGTGPPAGGLSPAGRSVEP